VLSKVFFSSRRLELNCVVVLQITTNLCSVKCLTKEASNASSFSKVCLRTLSLFLTVEPRLRFLLLTNLPNKLLVTNLPNNFSFSTTSKHPLRLSTAFRDTRDCHAYASCCTLSFDQSATAAATNSCCPAFHGRSAVPGHSFSYVNFTNFGQSI
jgi:hypothetical protein